MVYLQDAKFPVSQLLLIFSGKFPLPAKLSGPELTTEDMYTMAEVSTSLSPQTWTENDKKTTGMFHFV